MSDPLDELVLRYIKNPKLTGRLDHPTFTASGRNSLCGDFVRMTPKFENDAITDIRFEAKGCVLSRAAAALTAEVILGKGSDEIFAIPDDEILSTLGVGVVLRKQCALLPLFTVRAGLRAFLAGGSESSEHLLTGL